MVSLRLVNTTYASALAYDKPGVNKLWERLCRLRWPFISTKLKVSCEFPYAGNYELQFYGAEERGTTLWSVGRLQVNSTG